MGKQANVAASIEGKSILKKTIEVFVKPGVFGEKCKICIRGRSMKKILFCIMLFLTFSLYAETRTEYREEPIEGTFISSTLVKINKADFTIQGNKIDIKYSGIFDEYPYTRYETYSDVFEKQGKGKKADWVKINSIATGVGTRRAGTTERVEREVSVPDNLTVTGYVSIDLSYKKIFDEFTRGGSAELSDNSIKSILSNIFIKDSLDTRPVDVVTTINKIEVKGTVSFAESGFIADLIADTRQKISALNSSTVSDVSKYETYIKSAVELRSSFPYDFQKYLINTEISSVKSALYSKIEKEYYAIADKFPEFFIQGQIQDFIKGPEYTTFQIYGVTRPWDQTQAALRSPGFQSKKCNIRVIVSNKTLDNNGPVIWYGSSFVTSDRAKIFYAGRDTAKANDGSTVPLFIFYEQPTFPNKLPVVPGFSTSQSVKLSQLRDQLIQLYK